VFRARRSSIGALLALAIGLGIFNGAVSRSTSAASPPRLTDWPEFGLNPQRTDATDDSTGITASNVSKLRVRRVVIPGTADSSAVYLHRVTVDGRVHDVAVVTTSYGITVAIDANSGRILWTFTPPGIGAWKGGSQFTTASPIAAGRYVYATSPNGFVHRLEIASGHEAAGWPVRITVLPQREKLTASLNIADGELLATTGGYFGDGPPYVGHIVAISLTSGHVQHVFNTLCANRSSIISPQTCSVSDSAILSRSGPVVEPGATRVLIATGNGPYNGTTNFGDSVIELNLPSLTFRQAYTPADEAKLNMDDTDLGSGSPALLPGDHALIAGKDGILRLLNLAALDGHPPGSRPHTAGEVQTLPTPAGQQYYYAPAVWHNLVFVATGGGFAGNDDGGTAAYSLSGNRLRVVWQNRTPGTSPIVAGGLLFVYDPQAGNIVVYNPNDGAKITLLPAARGHWNGPIVADGHLIETTGNANDQSANSTVFIFSPS
jgi:outer membrane protein assembly factor BamB